MCQSAMVNCKVTTSSGTWLKIYSGLKIPPFSKINRPWLPELPCRKVGWGVSPTHSAMILWFDKKFLTNFQKIHYSKLSHSEKASKFEKKFALVLRRVLLVCYKNKWLSEGQLDSEWIHEVIISPKMQTKNVKDFFPTLL